MWGARVRCDGTPGARGGLARGVSALAARGGEGGGVPDAAGRGRSDHPHGGGVGRLGATAADGGDEEVRRRNREAQGHQGACGLHEVGRGVPGVSRPACTGAGSGRGCGVRRRRRICGSVGRGRAEGEAGAPADQGRRGEAQIVRTGPGGFRGGHAASHPLRQPGGCVEAGSEVRRGRLVRAAGRRPLRFPGAGLAVVVHDAADAALAVATIRSGTGGARARARDTWSGGKTACGGRDARRGCESARPATGALPRCVH